MPARTTTTTTNTTSTSPEMTTDLLVVQCLEKSRRALETSKGELTAELRRADATLSKVRHACQRAEAARGICEKRLTAVKTMQGKLCSDCIHIQTLVLTTTTSAKSGGKSSSSCCAACGGNLHPPDVMDIPSPADSHVLRHAKDSLKYSKTVVQVVSGNLPGEGTAPPRLPDRQTQDKESSSTPIKGNNNNNNNSMTTKRQSSTTPRNLFLERQSDKILLAAQQSRDTAVAQCDKMARAIEEWTEYRQKVERSLRKIETRAAAVKVRVGQALMEQLDSIRGGDSPSSSSHSNHDCIICEEHPKEIVFQCGHQCCDTCSSKLYKCHTCRQLISQRIRLFH